MSLWETAFFRSCASFFLSNGLKYSSVSSVSWDLQSGKDERLFSVGLKAGNPISFFFL